MASGHFWGARARFRYGGRYIGYCADVSGEEVVNYEEIHILNLLAVREHVPVAYIASVQASMFRILNNSHKAQGIFPTYDNILTSGELSAVVEDTLTGQSPYQFTGCRASSKGFDVSARGVTSERISFVALRQYDEFERPLAA
jgi:hypothetical protein